MSPEELKNFFIDLVDDEDLGDATMKILFNQAKNIVELEAKPQWLMAKDTSQTGTSGDTYETTKALPSDFRFMRKLYYGTTLLKPSRFEDSILNKDASNMYFIDHGNSTFSQTGKPGTSETYNMFYQKKSADIDDLASSDTSIITWPSEFHPLIGYEAAKIYQSTMDADDLAFRMSAAQEREYALMRRAFMDYCSELGLDDQAGEMGYAEEHYPIELGQM
jgi:hypothetical protein